MPWLGEKKENNYVFREIMLTIACPYVLALSSGDFQPQIWGIWGFSEGFGDEKNNLGIRVNLGILFSFWGIFGL